MLSLNPRSVILKLYRLTHSFRNQQTSIGKDRHKYMLNANTNQIFFPWCSKRDQIFVCITKAAIKQHSLVYLVSFKLVRMLSVMISVKHISPGNINSATLRLFVVQRSRFGPKIEAQGSRFKKWIRTSQCLIVRRLGDKRRLNRGRKDSENNHVINQQKGRWAATRTHAHMTHAHTRAADGLASTLLIVADWAGASALAGGQLFGGN